VRYICPVVYTSKRVGAVILDRQSVVPLYYQIQQRLSGTDTLRCTETRGVGSFGARNRRQAGCKPMTARQALKSLCSRGLTFSQRGRGTFCFADESWRRISGSYFLSARNEGCGSRPRSKVLAFKRYFPMRTCGSAALVRRKKFSITACADGVHPTALIGKYSLECEYLRPWP